MVCTSGHPFALLDVRVVIQEDEGSELPISPNAASGSGDAAQQLQTGAAPRDVAMGSGQVGEVWCRGPTVFAGVLELQSMHTI